MIITEKKTVYGTLWTQFGHFPMLSPYPNRHDVPISLRAPDVLSFFVVDTAGFGVIILAKGDFIIVPFAEVIEKNISFVVEDGNGVEIPEDRMSIVV